MKKSTCILLLVCTNILTFGLATSWVNSIYIPYVEKTEALLDRIYEDWESFLDVSGESDEYIEYTEALNNLKL